MYVLEDAKYTTSRSLSNSYYGICVMQQVFGAKQRKDSTKRSRHIRNFEWGCEFVLSFNNDLYFKGHKEEKEKPAVNNQTLMNQMKQNNVDQPFENK